MGTAGELNTETGEGPGWNSVTFESPAYVFVFSIFSLTPLPIYVPRRHLSAQLDAASPLRVSHQRNLAGVGGRKGPVF